MISAYHAYLIDPEIYRLDLEADRAQHRADIAGLTCLFTLLGPVTSSTSTAERSGSHFMALVGAAVGLHFAIRADDHARELDELREDRHARLLALANLNQPAL